MTLHQGSVEDRPANVSAACFMSVGGARQNEVACPPEVSTACLTASKIWRSLNLIQDARARSEQRVGIALGLIEHTHIIESEIETNWLNRLRKGVVLTVCRAPVRTVTGKIRRAVWRLRRNHRGLILSIL
jgi:hypothetical protein